MPIKTVSILANRFDSLLKHKSHKFQAQISLVFTDAGICAEFA